jgi:outer membrane protein assembly factor BamB
VVALTADAGELLWEAEIGGPSYLSPSIAGSAIYIVSEADGLMTAFDWSTGGLLWQYRTGDQGDWRSSGHERHTGTQLAGRMSA